MKVISQTQWKLVKVRWYHRLIDWMFPEKEQEDGMVVGKVTFDVVITPEGKSHMRASK